MRIIWYNQYKDTVGLEILLRPTWSCKQNAYYLPLTDDTFWKKWSEMILHGCIGDLHINMILDCVYLMLFMSDDSFCGCCYLLKLFYLLQSAGAHFTKDPLKFNPNSRKSDWYKMEWYYYKKNCPPSLNMTTSSNGNIFRVTGPLWGEFTGHRWIPLTKASYAELWCFFYLRLNKQLSKPSRHRLFEMQSRSLWRHCNDYGRSWKQSQCNMPRSCLERFYHSTVGGIEWMPDSVGYCQVS